MIKLKKSSKVGAAAALVLSLLSSAYAEKANITCSIDCYMGDPDTSSKTGFSGSKATITCQVASGAAVSPVGYCGGAVDYLRPELNSKGKPTGHDRWVPSIQCSANSLTADAKGVYRKDTEGPVLGNQFNWTYGKYGNFTAGPRCTITGIGSSGSSFTQVEINSPVNGG